MSLRISMAPCEKGSKMGISRDTLSRLKDETEATLPVLKKADWRSTKKKSATRASCRVRGRKGPGRVCVSSAGGLAEVVVVEPFAAAAAPLVVAVAAEECLKTACSSRTQLTRIAEKAR
jgi:hypothetical protein